MSLNKVRSGQIVDKDHVTEEELGYFALNQNIFITNTSGSVKVPATTNTPAALTITGILCANTTDSNAVTITGTAGERQVYAVRSSDTTVKTFTIEVVSDDTPTDADLSRKIATLDWDGTSTVRIKWNLSSRIQTETQTPGTNGQTVFTFTDIVYTPNTEQLLVFVNGQLQVSGVTFTETDSTSVTFADGTGIDTSSSLTFVKLSLQNNLA